MPDSLLEQKTSLNYREIELELTGGSKSGGARCTFDYLRQLTILEGFHLLFYMTLVFGYTTQQHPDLKIQVVRAEGVLLIPKFSILACPFLSRGR